MKNNFKMFLKQSTSLSYDLCSLKLACIMILLLCSVPLSMQAQYYDLSVGVERHMRMCYGINVICPLTSGYSETAIEKVIDEIDINGKTYAVVTFTGWIGKDENGNLQQTVSDTTFYRMDESILFENVNGIDVPVFDFRFTVGDSLEPIVAPYVNVEELWMTYFVDQQSVATFVLGDSLFHFEDGTYRNIILGGDIIDGDTLALDSLEFIIEDNLPRPKYGNLIKSPFMYVEGMGIMLTAPTHRNKIICGFRDASGNHFGCTAPWVTSIDNPDESIPHSFEIIGNYPNPFNPTTVIGYQLPQAEMVRLAVYDILGREVALLVDSHVSAGTHQVNFDGSGLSSGIYLYRLQAGNQVLTGKMMLMK